MLSNKCPFAVFSRFQYPVPQTSASKHPTPSTGQPINPHNINKSPPDTPHLPSFNMPHLLEKIKDKVHHHSQHADETHHSSPPVQQHNVDMSFASLYLHNQARNAKNVSSLVYDDQLAKDAADYAQKLADKDKLVSSDLQTAPQQYMRSGPTQISRIRTTDVFPSFTGALQRSRPRREPLHGDERCHVRGRRQSMASRRTKVHGPEDRRGQFGGLGTLQSVLSI